MPTACWLNVLLYCALLTLKATGVLLVGPSTCYIRQRRSPDTQRLRRVNRPTDSEHLLIRKDAPQLPVQFWSFVEHMPTLRVHLLASQHMYLYLGIEVVIRSMLWMAGKA